MWGHIPQLISSQLLLDFTAVRHYSKSPREREKGPKSFYTSTSTNTHIRSQSLAVLGLKTDCGYQSFQQHQRTFLPFHDSSLITGWRSVTEACRVNAQQDSTKIRICSQQARFLDSYQCHTSYSPLEGKVHSYILQLSISQWFVNRRNVRQSIDAPQCITLFCSVHT